jgi:hypothetical protein
MTYLNAGCKSPMAEKNPLEIAGETENFISMGIVQFEFVLGKFQIKV